MSTPTGSPSFTSRLRRKEEVAERTMSFEFDKPSGWRFKAGQFIDITIDNPPETDGRGNSRSFSIASAPQEETLLIATRMRDTAFKRVLKGLLPGMEVKVEGPFGNLTLHNNASRAAVILTGGIGITPFRSIVVRAAKEKLPHRIFLFYSNRRPEDAAFLDELQAVEHENPNYKFIGTMTEMEKSHRLWNGETSIINKEMLSKYLGNAASPIYYVAGPPEMVEDLQAMLNGAGVDDDDIRTEDFAGY